MDDREELVALRRMAELEAKAGKPSSKFSIPTPFDLFDMAATAAPKALGLPGYGPKAAADLAAMMGSGAVGRFLGLNAAGVAGLTGQGTDEAQKWLKDVQEGMTIEPRTAQGKQAAADLGKAVQWVSESAPAKAVVKGVDWVGEKSPVAGAVAKSIPDLAGVFAMRAPLRAAAEQTGNMIRPKLDPEVVRLLRVAQDEYQIPLRPDMVGKGGLGKAMGQFFERDVPGSGSQLANRETAMVRAVVKKFGGDPEATRLTPQVWDDAMHTVGGKIGDIASETTLADARAVVKSLAPAVENGYSYGKDVGDLVMRRARDFQRLIREDGTIDGAQFQKWNSRMLKDIRDGSNDYIKSSLSQLQETAFGAFESNIAPSKLPEWSMLRKQYAIGKQVMPLVAEPGEGLISPAKLSSAVVRGPGKEMSARGTSDLRDLASIGNRFLREPGGQTLPERFLAYSALGLGSAGLGTMLGPAAGLGAAGGLYALANLYNRLGPSAVRWLSKSSEGTSPSAMSAPAAALGSKNIIPVGEAKEIPMPAGLFDVQPTPSVKSSGLLANNASGESAASLEALRRMLREAKAGQDRILVNQDASTARKLLGPDAVDQIPQSSEMIWQKGVGKDMWTLIERGNNVTDSMVARARAKLEAMSKKD